MPKHEKITTNCPFTYFILGEEYLLTFYNATALGQHIILFNLLEDAGPISRVRVRVRVGVIKKKNTSVASAESARLKRSVRSHAKMC